MPAAERRRVRDGDGDHFWLLSDVYSVSQCGALALDEDAAQDLARSGFRNLVDELHATHLLVWRDTRGDERHQLFRISLAFQHDECFRDLASPLVWSGDDGGVGHRRMGQQDGFQFGGGDLEALVLDQLLEAVDDEEVTASVGAGQIPRMQPAVVVEHGGGRLRSIEVTPHHLWAADPQLAAFTGTNLGLAFRVDDPGLRV